MYDDSTLVTDARRPKKSLSFTKWISSLTLRHYLLGWAYMRMIVSIFWSIVFFHFTVITIVRISNCYGGKQRTPSECSWRMVLAIVASGAQIVEMAMITTFIVAGHKKSVKLYRIYWYYCLVTLTLYVLGIGMDMLPIDDNPLLGLYLTFHIPDMITIFRLPDYMFFFVVFAVDVCLEIALILLVKKQIVDITNEVKSKPNNDGLKTEGECTLNME